MPGRVALLLLALALTASCRQDSQIVLLVESDLRTPGELDEVRIQIDGPTRSEPPISVDLRAAGVALPLTLGLYAEDALAPVAVTVVGRQGGGDVVRQQARTGFVRGEVRLLRMGLARACVAAPACAMNATCVAGACRSPDIAGAMLPPWDGNAAPAPTIRPLPEDATVWTGTAHTCALRASGLQCWGKGDEGQLGNGANVDQTMPVMVKGLGVVTSAGAGDGHTCAVAGGLVSCWGRNGLAQLATATNRSAVNVPSLVGVVSDATAIDCGRDHTCALRTGGGVTCWGSNKYEQAGPFMGSARLNPSAIAGLGGVRALALGGNTSCARDAAGRALCWGSNFSGQLGSAPSDDRHPTPSPIPGLGEVTELAMGSGFGCAVLKTGQVRCWGSNEWGQLGTGVRSMTPLPPQEIPGLVDVVQLTAGEDHACARRRSGMVACWGRNESGAIGDATMGKSLARESPTMVSGLTDAVWVSAGGAHTCARRRSGAVVCWGANESGQLGDGGRTSQPAPVTVVGLGWP